MRKILLIAASTAILCLAVLTGCTGDSGVTDPGDGGNGGNGGGETDTLPPVVTITSPAGGTDLPSSLDIEGTATDDTEVDTVFFEVRDLCENPVWSGHDLATPYEATWDASGAQNGGYRVCMAAVDTAGNMSDWTCVNVSKGTAAAMIDGFSPKAAYIGRSIAVLGSGFGPDNGNGRVLVMGQEAAVEEWSDNEVKFVIPAGIPVDAIISMEILVDCLWRVTGQIEILPDRIIRVTDDMTMEEQPCWAGNSMLYFCSTRSGNWDVWRMDVDGSNWQQVTYYAEPDFNPDIKPSTGEMAWASMRGVPDDYGQASYDIFYGFLICPGGGCTEVNLTSDNDKCRAPDYANQMFGGYSMVYNRVYDPDDDGYGVPTLFLYSSTGGHVELTEGDNPSFDYSGRWVVFQDEDYDIARIEVGGSGDPEKLTTGYGDFNPDVGWQNDMVVFHRNGLNGYRGLCLVNMDGTGFEVLLEDRWDQYEAAWSPDCTMIAFTGHRMGNFDIYIYEVP